MTESRMTSVTRVTFKRLAARGSIGLVALALLTPGLSHARPVTSDLPAPSIDRWMNPFNTQRGYRIAASTFGSIGVTIPGFDFDDRYSQLLVGFDLPATIPTGRGACGYRVTSATLRLSVSENLAFQYDPTFDARSTYNVADDGDGRPMELFGVGYRNGWTSCRIDPGTPALNQFPCFYEGSASLQGPEFSPGSNPNQDVRNAFATDFAGGMARDVSNFVRDQVNVTPFAIGQISGLSAGALVPVDSEVVFTLDVQNPDVQTYLRNAANTGLLRLMVASMHPATSSGGVGSGSFATFYCKEIGISGLAGRLSISVNLISPGDADGNESVNFADITSVLLNFSAAGAGLAGDANCDGVVNFADITSVLLNFGN